MIHPASSMLLILANLIPVAGVFLFQWDILAVLLMYWAETLIVGVLNVVKLILCPFDNILAGIFPKPDRQSVIEPAQATFRRYVSGTAGVVVKFFLMSMFVLHYGIFCFGYLIGVVVYFSDREIGLGAGFPLAELWQGSFWIYVGAIFLNHLYDFVKKYIGNGEYKIANVRLLMFRPFGRVLVMHLAIALGAGLVIELDSSLPIFLILIIAKTILDLRFHTTE